MANKKKKQRDQSNSLSLRGHISIVDDQLGSREAADETWNTMKEGELLRITIGTLTFLANLETKRAPKTVAAIRGILPLEGILLQARWSGESAWVPG